METVTRFSVREKGERERGRGREKCRLVYFAEILSGELTGSSLLKMHEHLEALANSFADPASWC